MIVCVTALMSTIQVFLMRNRNTGVEVAAKCLQKHTSWTPEKFRQRVAEEVSCLFTYGRRCFFCASKLKMTAISAIF